MAAEITQFPSASDRSDSLQNAAIWTGFTGEFMALSGGAERDKRPLSSRWMTDELIAYTRRVWSTYLGYPVTEAEAIEMLTNVRNVALAIQAAKEEGEPTP